MADKLINLEIQIGPSGGILKDGKYFYGALRDEIIETLGGIEKIKGELKGQSLVVTVTASNVNKQIASQLGNYFEYACYQALINIIKTDPDVNQSLIGQEQEGIGKRKDNILKILYGLVDENKIKKFIVQADQQAQQGAAIFWADYKKNFINEKGKIEQAIELQWLGGGGGIGDLRLIIGNVIWMIECKFYSSYTVDSTGIHYFNLSDARENFKTPFWQFLKKKGPPYWNKTNPSEENIWYNKVTSSGFWSWLKNESKELGNNNLAVFSFLLQKGQQYEVLKYWEKKGISGTSGGRGIITGIKYSGSANSKNLTVDIDLGALVSDFKISAMKKQGQIDFLRKVGKNKKLIATASLSSDTLETIRNNSNNNSPELDGEGWVTHLAFVLQRDMLTPFPILNQ